MLELIDREERYEIFLDASPWGILVSDKTFRIVYANKTLQLMSGYSLNEMLGEHIQKLMPRSDRKVHTVHEKKYIKSPHQRQGNHGLHPKILSKYGIEIPVEISLSPTKVQGQTYFFASIRPLESLFNTVEGKEIDN